MTSIQIQFGHAEGRPKGLHDGVQQESQNGTQKSTEMKSFWEPPGARNGLVSCCFRTKTAPTGHWTCSEKVSQKGTKRRQERSENGCKSRAADRPAAGRAGR